MLFRVGQLFDNCKHHVLNSLHVRAGIRAGQETQGLSTALAFVSLRSRWQALLGLPDSYCSRVAHTKNTLEGAPSKIRLAGRCSSVTSRESDTHSGSSYPT